MKPNNRLEVHFLNVDHGDCTIIRHPGDQHRKKGRITFVDINDWKDKQPSDQAESIAGLSRHLDDLYLNTGYSSGLRLKQQISEEDYAENYLDDPLAYFDDEVRERGQDIWRFICTHPDMDHLSGLDRLCQEEAFSIFWDTDHEKDLNDEDDWPPQYEKEDWDRYDAIRSGDTDHQYIQPTRGDKEQYWEHDQIDILHPSPEFVEEMNDDVGADHNPKYNDVSYVLKVNTAGGAILLPGDAEKAAWEDILNDLGPSVLEDVRVLKAAHHGRKDGFYKEAVEAMDPEYVIMSVGAKPSTDGYMDYYRTCSDDTKIWSTRQHGWIRFTVANSGAMIAARREPDGIFDLPAAV